jgi:hypothetical protein
MELTHKRFLVTIASIAALAGVSAVASVIAAHHTKPVTLPDQTRIQVTLDQALASDQSRPGDHFEASVVEPIVADKKTVIPQGAHVEGVVVDARPSGGLRGRARLQLELTSVEVAGRSYEIRSSSLRKVGAGHKKRNWAWIGGGGAGGALIGAVAAGGKGALIGGPIGAGAGTAAAYLTGKKDIHLAPETQLTFELAEPLTIDVKS